MTQRHDHLDLAAILIMTVLCASWGLNQVAIKLAYAGFSPLFGAGLRGAAAGLLVLLWCAARGVRLFERDGSLALGALTGLLFASEFALVYWGLVYTTAARSVIFMYLAPFIVAIGAHLWIPGERIGPWQAAGLACAFAGMATAFSDALALPNHRELWGDLMVVAAAILWGMTTVLVKASRLARIAPAKTLLYQLAGSALLLPVAIALGEPGITHPGALAIAALAYQAAIVAFASYLAWFWLVAHYPASRLSAFSFLAPILGVIAGGALLGEPVSPALGIALALVALGIWLVNRRSRGVPRRGVAAGEEPA
jgi:drug/metabolite transporter (DMT)-like permease